MPACRVAFYQDTDGMVPVLDWLRRAECRDRGVAPKCFERIARLAELGHELRRPLGDYVRDGIYELRIRKGKVNYRILYFFHGDAAVVLAHGLAKGAAVPVADIERARERKELYQQDPEGRSYYQDGGMT
jgi:phage-related protein